MAAGFIMTGRRAVFRIGPAVPAGLCVGGQDPQVKDGGERLGEGQAQIGPEGPSAAAGRKRSAWFALSKTASRVAAFRLALIVQPLARRPRVRCPTHPEFCRSHGPEPGQNCPLTGGGEYRRAARRFLPPRKRPHGRDHPGGGHRLGVLLPAGAEWRKQGIAPGVLRGDVMGRTGRDRKQRRSRAPTRSSARPYSIPRVLLGSDSRAASDGESKAATARWRAAAKLSPLVSSALKAA